MSFDGIVVFVEEDVGDLLPGTIDEVPVNVIVAKRPSVQ